MNVAEVATVVTSGGITPTAAESNKIGVSEIVALFATIAPSETTALVVSENTAISAFSDGNAIITTSDSAAITASEARTIVGTGDVTDSDRVTVTEIATVSVTGGGGGIGAFSSAFSSAFDV